MTSAQLDRLAGHPLIVRFMRAIAEHPAREISAEGRTRLAAILLVLRAREDGEPELLMIKRADAAGDPWSGHIACPGGRMEPGDRDLAVTAVRETWEETGIDVTRDGRLIDLSSSYVEGRCCPLAKRGYSRDGKKGTLQINYGLLTDPRGCPVAVSVHEGNTADSATFLPEVRRLREDFGLEQLVMVGDRGMISSKAIDALRETDGIGWITALKSVSIRALVEQGHLQIDLFDERNLLELSSPDYPGERLVACRNPQLAKRRAHKREELLLATERTLEKITVRVAAGRLAGQDAIGVCVGKVVNHYKVAKHFTLTIDSTAFTVARKADSIAREAALDGLYIIRTSVRATEMDAADCVRTYKSLANVERAFRSFKSVDLQVRPIHHRKADRVRAHIFLCMLTYYVEWHMREAWRALMFADTDQHAKATRDPVAPAIRSTAAAAKASRHRLEDGTPAHSFSTLLATLATIVRNTCRTPHATPDAPTFEVLTTPTATQQRALALIQQITV